MFSRCERQLLNAFPNSERAQEVLLREDEDFTASCLRGDALRLGVPVHELARRERLRQRDLEISLLEAQLARADDSFTGRAERCQRANRTVRLARLRHERKSMNDILTLLSLSGLTPLQLEARAHAARHPSPLLNPDAFNFDVLPSALSEVPAHWKMEALKLPGTPVHAWLAELIARAVRDCLERGIVRHREPALKDGGLGPSLLRRVFPCRGAPRGDPATHVIFSQIPAFASIPMFDTEWPLTLDGLDRVADIALQELLFREDSMLFSLPTRTGWTKTFNVEWLEAVRDAFRTQSGPERPIAVVMNRRQIIEFITATGWEPITDRQKNVMGCWARYKNITLHTTAGIGAQEVCPDKVVCAFAQPEEPRFLESWLEPFGLPFDLKLEAPVPVVGVGVVEVLGFMTPPKAADTIRFELRERTPEDLLGRGGAQWHIDP